ncbi:Uncharacterised protein [Mycobacteroides abscessus subsp. abscessus]|nr:Uncharacterised protein [Mycobacteroides abscessus subsp. abscessus]
MLMPIQLTTQPMITPPIGSTTQLDQPVRCSTATSTTPIGAPK